MYKNESICKRMSNIYKTFVKALLNYTKAKDYKSGSGKEFRKHNIKHFCLGKFSQ